MKGLFSFSFRCFHLVPRRFDISELCIFGFSRAIRRRCARDQTMNAFIGLLTRSYSFLDRFEDELSDEWLDMVALDGQ